MSLTFCISKVLCPVSKVRTDPIPHSHNAHLVCLSGFDAHIQDAGKMLAIHEHKAVQSVVSF